MSNGPPSLTSSFMNRSSGCSSRYRMAASLAHWNQNTTALLRGCERLVAGARYRSIKTLIALRQCGRELRFSSAHCTEFARNPSSRKDRFGVSKGC